MGKSQSAGGENGAVKMAPRESKKRSNDEQKNRPEEASENWSFAGDFPVFSIFGGRSCQILAMLVVDY